MGLNDSKARSWARRGQLTLKYTSHQDDKFHRRISESKMSAVGTMPYRGGLCPFYGRKDGTEDPADVFDELDYQLASQGLDTGEKCRSPRMMMCRRTLRDDALAWVRRVSGTERAMQDSTSSKLKTCSSCNTREQKREIIGIHPKRLSELDLILVVTTRILWL